MQAESEVRYRALAEASLEAIFVEVDGRCAYANPAAARLLGVDAPGELVGSSPYDFMLPEEHARARERKARILAGEPLDQRAEYRWRRRDGHVVHAETTTVRVEWGESPAVQVVARDVTERHRAEQALRESEARADKQLAELDAIYSGAPVGLCVVDRDLRYVRINSRLAAMNRIPAADHLGRRVREVVPVLADGIERMLRLVLDTGRPVLDVDLSPGGSPPDVARHWRASGHPLHDAVGRVTGVSVVAEEVTAQKRASAALRESAERYARQVRLFEGVTSTTPDFVYLFDREGRFLYANRRLLEVWGMALEEAVGHTCLELGYERWHHDMHMREIAQVIATRAPIKGEVPFRAPRTGIYGVYEYIFTPVIGPDGEVEMIAGTTRDVTERKQVEERVRLGEQFVRRVLDNLFAFVGVMTPDGTVVEVNRAPLEVSGIAAGDVIGKKLWDSYWWSHSAEGRERLREAAAQALAGRTVRYDTDVRIAGDGRLWIDFQIAPLLDDQGRVTHLVPSAMDLTERKRIELALQTSRRRLQQVSDTAAVLIANFDRQGRHQFVNRAYAARFGRHPREIVGLGLADVIGPAAAEQSRPYNERVLAGETVTYELELQYRDLGPRWMRIDAAPERDDSGGIVGWVSVMLDITAQRALEGDRDRLIAALKDADRRKDEFLATLAHELRNPLAPLRTAAHILRAPQVSERHRAEAQAMIERQIATMVRLVDDLLDVSRVTLGRIELRRAPVSVAVAIDHAVEAAGPAIEAGRHRLQLELAEDLPWVDADVTRLAQVLTNLLTNAAKYTPPGGRIGVSARSEGDEAVIAVRDSGIGIPRDMLVSIFDLFAQVPRGESMSQGGLGIGLALARRLVEMHGGTIEARSEGEGRGSELVVRLPRCRVDEGAGRPAANVARAVGEGRRVLVVDDNVDAAESLALVLRLQGHAARSARSGREALDLLAQEPVDVVLLDIGMPGMDGYEVAHRIHDRLGRAAPVLVALTGWGQAADRERAAAAGFDSHLTKPADPAAVAELIARAPAREHGKFGGTNAQGLP